MANYAQGKNGDGTANGVGLQISSALGRKL